MFNLESNYYILGLVAQTCFSCKLTAPDFRKDVFCTWMSVLTVSPGTKARLAREIEQETRPGRQQTELMARSAWSSRGCSGWNKNNTIDYLDRSEVKPNLVEVTVYEQTHQILNLCILKTPDWILKKAMKTPDEMPQKAAFHQGCFVCSFFMDWSIS